MAANLTQLAQESSEWCLASDVKLLAWLKHFSQDIRHRTEALTGRIEALSHDALVAQADLRNAFTSLNQLSNTQFIEQRVQDEDEISAPSSPPPQRASRPPIAPGPESFEQDVVPKYREAVQVAWQSLKSTNPPSMNEPFRTNPIKEGGSRSGLSSPPKQREAGLKSGRKQEWVDRPLPLILGTDAFLADEFCGLPPPDTEEYRPSVTESHERDRRESHFAGPSEDEGGVTEKGGERGGDTQSEGGEVEDGWTQISSRKEYSEIEPAVSAALNFRAMLEEALRGPSAIYDDVSSPSTRPPTHEGESDSATSASHDDASGAPIREAHYDAKKQESLSTRGGGNEGSTSSRDHGERTSMSAFPEEVKQGLEPQRDGDGSQSRGNNVSEGKAKRVVFSEDADEERSVSFGGDQGEESQAEAGERAGASGKGNERSYGGEWDDEEFSFGASTSLKSKPSYTLDLDDLFKRKPRTAPLPNGAAQSGDSLGAVERQGSAVSQPSRNGLGQGSGATSKAAAGAGSHSVESGLGVGLGSKNAAVDAITAALKQRQAASTRTPEEPNEYRVSGSVSVDPVKTPSGAGLRKPVSVEPEKDRAGSNEEGGWSPSLTHPPLRTELSFGPVEEHGERGESFGEEQDWSGVGAIGVVRTDDEVGHLGNGDDRGDAASDSFPAGSGRLHGRLEADTGSVGASDSGVGEGGGIRTKGQERTEADGGLLRTGDTKQREDRETAEATVPQPGGKGEGTGSGGLFGEGPSEAEARGGETSASGGRKPGFGKGGARSRLFGDSDEDDDYGLPLFGGKLGQRPGGRRRGLFEDSDEEPGRLGFGRRSTGLFDNGYGFEKDDRGGQKRSTGLFGESENATGGLFLGDHEKGSVSSGSSLEASKSAAEGSPKSHAAQAARKVDEGLFGAPKQHTALSADLFGDDEGDGDFFGVSGLGRPLRGKPGAEEAGPKRTSGVSALLESTYSSDEEDPWEGRLAKLKERQDSK